MSKIIIVGTRSNLNPDLIHRLLDLTEERWLNSIVPTKLWPEDNPQIEERAMALKDHDPDVLVPKIIRMTIDSLMIKATLPPKLNLKDYHDARLLIRAFLNQFITALKSYSLETTVRMALTDSLYTAMHDQIENESFRSNLPQMTSEPDQDEIEAVWNLIRPGNYEELIQQVARRYQETLNNAP